MLKEEYGKKFNESNQLTPWSRIHLEKLTGPQLVKKLPVFYATRRFIVAFIRAHQLSLYWARLIRFMPAHSTWRSILILSSHLHLGLPSHLFPSGLPTKTVYAPVLPQYPYPAHLNLELITLIIFGDECRSYLYPLKPFPCFQGGFITFLMPGPQTCTCSQLRQFFFCPSSI